MTDVSWLSFSVSCLLHRQLYSHGQRHCDRSSHEIRSRSSQRKGLNYARPVVNLSPIKSDSAFHSLTRKRFLFSPLPITPIRSGKNDEPWTQSRRRRLIVLFGYS